MSHAGGVLGKCLERAVGDSDLLTPAMVERIRYPSDALDRSVVDVPREHRGQGIIVGFLPVDEPSSGSRSLDLSAERVRDQSFVESRLEIVQPELVPPVLIQKCQRDRACDVSSGFAAL